MNLTGYNLSRKWFDFCFENPEKVAPIHTALYFFAIEHCNRLGWKKKFGLPTEMAKEAIGIKSWHTYIKAFNDIIDWGFFIIIERSKNQYSSNIIALIEFDEAFDEAFDKALAKHISKQEQSTSQSNDSIIKLITNNLKQITDNFEIFESFVLKIDKIDKIEIKEDLEIKNNLAKEKFNNFRLLYPGTKKGNETEFENFTKKTKDWKIVIDLLLPAINNQIKDKQYQISRNKFVAEWKHLSTWINKRCWEEETINKEIKITQTVIPEGMSANGFRKNPKWDLP